MRQQQAQLFAVKILDPPQRGFVVGLEAQHQHRGGVGGAQQAPAVVPVRAQAVEGGQARAGERRVLGLRGAGDFEYEFQMTGMNRALNDDIEQLFLMADVALQPIASKLVKEIALYGGDIHKFVPPRIADEVIARVADMQAAQR